MLNVVLLDELLLKCSTTVLQCQRGFLFYKLMDHAHHPMWLLEVHYNDVIRSAMASQITNLMIVNLSVYSRLRSKKISKLSVTGFWEGNSPVIGEFPAQRAGNAENVSIRWRHHVHNLFAVTGYIRLRSSGLVYPRSLISPLDAFLTLKKLKTVKHIHISLVIPQLNWGGFCRIRTCY